jgi:hypothetical protein
VDEKKFLDGNHLFNRSNWTPRQLAENPEGILLPRIKTREFWEERLSRVTDTEAVKALSEADVKRLWSPYELTTSPNTRRDNQLLEFLRQDLRTNDRIGLNGPTRKGKFQPRADGTPTATIGFGELTINGESRSFRMFKKFSLYELYKTFSGGTNANKNSGYSRFLENANDRHLPSEVLGTNNRNTDAEPRILEHVLSKTTPGTEGELVLSVSRETCNSCDFYGIPRFQRLRPGIKIKLKNP